MRMLDMAKDNVHYAFNVFAKRNGKEYEELEVREKHVDFLNKEISKYITSVLSYENTKMGSKIFNCLYTITSNIKRISDHALNISNEILKIAMEEK